MDGAALILTRSIQIEFTVKGLVASLFTVFTLFNMSKTVAARVDECLAQELDQLAHRTGRNRSILIAEALRSYLASESAFFANVDAGLADLDAGRSPDPQTIASAIRRIYRSKS